MISNVGYVIFQKNVNMNHMKISKMGSTLQQQAYARRVWGGKQTDKQQTALDVGYSPSVARSCVSKIESRKGFNNAMAKLAAESNNLALSIMHEFKSRGVKDFSNKDLVGALNAIAGAWDRFNKGLIEKPKVEDNGKNRLRTIVLQSVAAPIKDVESTPSPATPPSEIPKDLDF